jgi:hypothetical protein
MRQPGDIVVIVPRWLIAAVGLLMLLMGLTASFLFLFAGLITEGIFFSLAVVVLVLVQLLVLYIVWRFYWYVLIAAILIQGLLMLTVLTGFVRMGGNTTAFVRSGLTGAPVFPMGDALALIVLLSFATALIVVLVIALLLKSIIGSPFPAPRLDYDVDDLDKPRRRKQPSRRDLWKDDRPYPPPNDPYWDDQ